MRTAQLIGNLEMGGAEALAIAIANRLAAQGNESHLFVTGKPGAMSTKVDGGVHAHYLEFPPEALSNPVRHPFLFTRQFRQLSRALRGHRVQIVQTHLPGSNFWGLLLELRGICPAIATIHNNREFDYGASGNRVRLALRKVAYRAILKHCHQVVAVSESVRSSLLAALGNPSAYSSKIAVVANGVPIPDLMTLAQRSAARVGLGLCDGEFFILGAGRHSPQKNFSDLVAAAELLRNSACRFRLVIAGDGELTGDLAAQVAALGLEQNVILSGPLQELGKAMQAADVFVIPSLWEGVPLVLLEAMAAGLPTVGYRIPGIEEIVTHGRNGLLVEPGRPDLLAKEIRRLAQDPGLIGRLGAEAQMLRLASQLEQAQPWADKRPRLGS